MDKRIFGYFKGKKEMTLILIALALGLMLIFFGTREDVSGEDASPGLEESIAKACSGVEGVGECAVYLYYSEASSRSEADKVESVLVICEGADSDDVKLRLTEMLSSFFGIGTNRVRIEKMQT